MRTRTPVILSLLLLLTAAPAASAQTETFVPYALRPEQTAVRVWTSGERTHARVNIVFNDGGYRVVDWQPPVRSGNDFVSHIKLERWTGRTETRQFQGDRRVFVLGQLLP